MSTEEPTLPKYVTNEGLFQQYYLAAYLQPTIPLTQDDLAHGANLDQARAAATDALSQIQEAWHKQRDQLTLSEANVEDFVKDVCVILGMSVSSQGGIRREGDTTQRVDLALFADDDANKAFVEHIHTHLPAEQSYADALAVVEVKTVDKPFAPQKSKDQPIRQIVGYLTHTGVPWGILTDGYRWHLYRRFDPPRYNEHLEINLAQILAISDPEKQREAFWWFYTFFHRDALYRHKQPSRVDSIYAGSVRHAIGVQESLRDQAFQVVEELARGIYVAQSTPEHGDMETLYEQAIIILFRLLFLKFAEDKKLLPVDNRTYQHYGYAGMEKELLANFDDPNIKLNESAVGCISWFRLENLFKQLNIGNPEADIFAYNGGLFRPDRVEGIRIPDAFLARAIVHLTRIERDGKPLRVSYRDLETRHLGSIYEGLLEQHLVQEHGTVRMVSTAGEQSNKRRTSGSYYTPDYIVDYIVQQTIDPLCTGKCAEEIAQIRILDPSMGSGHFLVAALHRLAHHHAMALNRESAPPPQRDPGETEESFAEREQEYYAHIAPTEQEVAASAHELVEHCIYGVDLNPLAVELAKLALWLSTLAKNRALSFLNHHLRVGNSLVGASIENLGSLATLPVNGYGNGKKNNGNGKKKNGNGNGKKKNGNGNGTVYQMGLFEQIVWRVRDTILAYFQRIADLPSTTPEQIHQKEQEYAHVRAYSQPFRQVANLWVSSYFGNAVTSQQAVDALEAIDDFYANPSDRTKWDVLETHPWFLHAQEIAKRKGYCFFHWELEFPQIFLREEPGFDAVVGNPPYIRIQHLSSAEVAYFSQMFTSPSANYDIYLVFIEHALTMVKQKNPMGFIVPHKFITTAYGKKLCRLLSDTYYVEQLVHFGDVQVFAGAINYVCLLFVRNELRMNRKTRFIPVTYQTTDLDALPVKYLSAESFQGERWILATDEKQSCMKKLQSCATPLGQFSKAHYCLFTGLNEAFVVTGQQVQQHKLEQELVKPLLRGQDVQRWETRHNDLFIIYPYTVNAETHEVIPVDITAYPHVYRYLLQFKDKLVNRIKFEQKVKDKTKREQRFFEYIDPRHPDQFEKTKLIVPEIKSSNAFVLDQEQFYALNKAYVIKFNIDMFNGFFLNALLNSKVLEFFYHQIAVILQNGFYEYTSQHIEQLPIRRIHFTTPAQERTQRVSECIAQVETATSATAPLAPLQDVATFRSSDMGQACATLLPMDDDGQFLAFKDGATGTEEHSDVVHDVLAHLAQRMIDLKKQRHHHITNVLTDLEGALHKRDWKTLGKTYQLWNPTTKKAQTADAEDAPAVLGSLSGKTLTIDDDIGSLSRDQWKWLLKYKLGSVKKLSRLLDIYDEYHADIAAVDHQITATDALIDQMVYLLYGLTADDVAMIESAKGENG